MTIKPEEVCFGEIGMKNKKYYTGVDIHHVPCDSRGTGVVDPATC